MAVSAFLYDAEGHDGPIALDQINLEAGDQTLLWVDLLAPSSDETARVAASLQISQRCILHRPTTEEASIQNFGDHLTFFLTLPSYHPLSADHRSGHKGIDMLGFVVGDGWLITSHEGDAPLLEQFKEKDRGETSIGALSSSALAASLIDWHLGLFFDAANGIAAEVDTLDEHILRDTASKSLLGRIVMLRRKLSRVRAALVVNRPVFYGLSRVDCLIVAKSDAADHYALLSSRFERALDEIERVRDLINGSFDLFASRSGLQTNNLVKALTVVTAVLGYFGAVAGLMGMNLKSTLFNGGDRTFAVIVITLSITSAAAIIFARRRKWL